MNESNQNRLDGVAIIGMAARFPGADTIDTLWQNLCDGVESIKVFNDDELDANTDAALKQNPDYIKARGIISDIDCFDAAFFGISPREAEAIDPQQRVFLEMAWAALESAGYDPDSFPGLIGVYAGTGNNTYFPKNLASHPELIAQIGEFQMATLNEKDYIATRVSYKLNLKGPSVSVHTACSTSLVAVNEAFHSLMGYQCDMALAGGVSITVPQNSGYLYQEGAIFSKDGHCRSFDAQAAGTVFSDGVGVVVLKRLEDAVQDGDLIYAVIRGAATNNDGAAKMSFAAPSVDGQAEAIAMAQSYADVHPETISYIEAHGTATPLGDPIEIEALTQAFRAQTNAKQFCAIGSIKSNFGHTIAAAGVAGLIKTALALKHRLLPPSLHFETPNPRIDFTNSPFYVNAKLTAWQRGETPLRAGVSSFGVGGSNAHVVLEEAPIIEPASPSRPRQLLLISAKTASALDTATANLRQHLSQTQSHSDHDLVDVAYTLQVGRKGFNHRRMIVCGDRAEAIQVLETLPPKQSATRYTPTRDPEIIFMFPGQGSQYLNMGLNLYQHEPLFRETVDRCAIGLKPWLGLDLRDILYPQTGDEETATAQLKQTQFTQPALFTIEYALAQLWQSWGIEPQGMIGHSIGEFVAACRAGVFSLEDALKLVATRGRLVQELPAGSMLSVRTSAAKLESRLGQELAIAAINAPNLCVVSGPEPAIHVLQQELEQEGIVCKPLHTSHAFHSPMMDEIVAPFTKCVQEVKLHTPTLPFVSTVTATWITPEQATDPQYWGQHLRATVRFADGIQTLWEQPARVLLEVGPRTTAATLARQQAKDLKQQIAISSLSDTATNQAEWAALLNAVGQLWLAGAAIDWQAFYAQERRYRVPLPTYPFERKRFWIEPRVPTPSMDAADPSPTLSQTTQTPLPQVLISAQPTVETDFPIGVSMSSSSSESMSPSRQQTLIPQLKEILEDTSGLELDDVDEVMTFMEMGLESLSLTQVALILQNQFKIKLTFRQLLEDFPSLGTLAEFIDSQLPPVEPSFIPPVAPIAAPIPTTSSIPAPAPTATPPSPLPATPSSSPSPLPLIPSLPAMPSNGLETVIAQQLQIMARQLELLSGGSGLPSGLPLLTTDGQVVPQSPQVPTPVVSNGNGKANGNGNAIAARPELSAQSPKTDNTSSSETKKAFGAAARIDTSEGEALTPQQQQNLEALIQRYIARTKQSKQFTQSHRSHLADPRAVSGFNRRLKEMVYPIVTNRSSGSKIWDIDGNEYLDLTNGFGSNFFGHLAPYITEAISAQLQQGIEIGPQTPLAGEVAELICEFTKLDRVAFCNTGSEAVLGAMRLARTVTGRNTIAFFSGDYHGIFDEVIVRGTKKLKSIPAAPGIPPNAVENVLILDYDSPESLEILRSRANDLAAIMIEPVQSRRPELQPREFIHELRRICDQSGAVFIMDEVITGFRIHPGGAQAHFGVQADIATYGKVVGGGMPIGVIAGKSAFMDALDGGYWQYGDDSFPQVGVTYFAGTFVRHPLTLAAAKAALEYMKQQGPELQRSLNERTAKLVVDLKQCFEQLQAPFTVKHFSSFFKIIPDPDYPLGDLLFYLLREKGIYILDSRLCFLTLAHTEADLESFLKAVKQSVLEMQEAGFLPSSANLATAVETSHFVATSDNPPVPNAQLGRDAKGFPAWFIPDPDRVGKYLQVG